MKINFEGFYESLDIMWKGMAGLFIVSISIMLIVMALKFLMRRKKPAADAHSSG